MKKLLTILLILAMSVLTLASCESTPAPTVKDITLNEDGSLNVNFTDGTSQKADAPAGGEEGSGTLADAELSFDKEGNLIATYPDGKTETLGKDALKTYTVTFLDHDGTVLAIARVYAGLPAIAPADPVREDYIFAGWDKAFDSVTEDMTVTATYTPMTSYTVTFVDHDGTVLKSAMVVSGKDATPPADPTREGYNFKGWQGDYTAITKDTEIRAEYTEKGSYTVTFVDFNGLKLGEATVKEGESATAPASPTREGYTFTGWSSALTNITANKTVSAQYKLVSKANVFDISYKVSGKTVTLTLTLTGTVYAAGAEGFFHFTGMTATAVKSLSSEVNVNLLPDGRVTFALAHADLDAPNLTATTALCTVTLTAGDGDHATADLTVEDIFDAAMEEGVILPHTVIGESIKLK